jgi:hypothetical protein
MVAHIYVIEVSIGKHIELPHSPELSRDELSLELIAKLERELATRMRARKAQTDASQACINYKSGVKLCSVEALEIWLWSE